jgi:transposase
MGEQRQRYNEEFKQQTVKFIQEQTKTITDISQELNIPAGTLHQWVAKYRKFESEPLASTEKVRELEQRLKEQERELNEKDRRIADVEEELAIVKKAVHIFSKPRN